MVPLVDDTEKHQPLFWFQHHFTITIKSNIFFIQLAGANITEVHSCVNNVAH